MGAENFVCDLLIIKKTQFINGVLGHELYPQELLYNEDDIHRIKN